MSKLPVRSGRLSLAKRCFQGKPSSTVRPPRHGRPGPCIPMIVGGPAARTEVWGCRIASEQRTYMVGNKETVDRLTKALDSARGDTTC